MNSSDGKPRLRFPTWSALILVPIIIFADSYWMISGSKSPVTVTLVLLGFSIVCGVIGWGMLMAWEKIRRKS